MSRMTSALSDKTDKRLLCKVRRSTQNTHLHTYTQVVVYTVPWAHYHSGPVCLEIGNSSMPKIPSLTLLCPCFLHQPHSHHKKSPFLNWTLSFFHLCLFLSLNQHNLISKHYSMHCYPAPPKSLSCTISNNFQTSLKRYRIQLV